MTKSKGTAGGNPSPVQTPEFLAHIKQHPSDLPDGVSLGSTICVALPEEVDQAVQTLPNRSAWLRKVITEAAQRELLPNNPDL